MEPIKVAFTAGQSRIAAQIATRLAQQQSKPSHASTFGQPNDPIWCAKVEEIILLMINQILATQIANFIRQWDLPRAVEIADGVSLAPNYIGIHGDDLVVGAQITTAPIGLSPLQARMEMLVNEFNRRTSYEFSTLTDTELESWAPDKSPTVRWLTQYRDTLEESAGLELQKSSAQRTKLVPPNLQLLANDRLFDILAKRYLSVNQGWEGSAELDRLLKAEIGWWFRVENGKGKVIPAGIEIHADVAIGGRARVCHFDIDPKSFGQWKCHGPCVELSPQPDFGIQAFPTFPADGIYLNAKLLTTGIAVRYCDWPAWANRILGWVTGNLTRPLLAAIAAIVARFRVRIAQYPRHFPGTGSVWRPNMNVDATNIGPYLVFSGDPTFE